MSPQSRWRSDKYEVVARKKGILKARKKMATFLYGGRERLFTAVT